MKSIMENKFIKTILSAIILFSMLISYVAPLSLALEGENTNVQSGEEEYVKIVTSDIGSEVEAGTDVSLNISTEFTKIQTGFKNVSVLIKSVDEDETPSVDIVSDSSKVIYGPNYIELKYGTVSTGTQNLENIILKFSKTDDFKPYNKSILIKVIGQYKNPQNGELDTINFEKTIQTKVKTVEYPYTVQAPSILIDSWDCIYPYKTQALEKGVPSEIVSRVKGNIYGDNEFYSESFVKELNIELEEGKNINELRLGLTIPYVQNRTGMILNLDEFINDGFTIEDINGDEETDEYGKNYVEGIAGVTAGVNELAFTSLQEGNLKITLVKTANSDDIVDAFNVNKKFTSYITTYTGITEEVATEYRSNGVTEIDEEYNIIADVVASGYNYTQYYDEENEIIKVKKEQSSDSNVEEDADKEVRLFVNIKTGNQIGWPVTEGSNGHGVNTIRIQEYEQNNIQFKSHYTIWRNWNNDYVDNADEVKIKFNDYKLEYISDEGDLKTIELDSDMLKIKSVSGECKIPQDYVGTTSNKLEIYSAEEFDEKIGSPKLEINTTDTNVNFEGQQWISEDGNNNINLKVTYNSNIGIEVNWELSYEKLIELGLSETEIANMKVLQNRTDIYDNKTRTKWYKIFETWDSSQKLSYINVDANNYNTQLNEYNQAKEKEFNINMRHTDRIDEKNLIQYTIYNENPIFYIKLSEDFLYKNPRAEITNNGTAKENSNLKIVGTPYYKYVNNELYLVIETEGTYNSDRNNDIQITVNINKKLVNPEINNVQELEVYMITDNGKYYENTSNENRLTKEGIAPNYLFLATDDYYITGESTVSATSSIIKQFGRFNIIYQPNAEDETDKTPEKNSPLVLLGGEIAKFQGLLNNNQTKELSNVELMYRLPVANNKDVDGTRDILGSNFTLSDVFIDSHPKLINVIKNQPVNQVSLIDLENIKVLVDKVELDSSKYTLYYATADATDFDVTNTTNYTQVTDETEIPATARTIIVKLNEELPSGSNVKITYEMTMPQADAAYSMTGAMFGAQYQYKDVNEQTQTSTLDSEAAYVIKGERATLNIQKTFEGYTAGTTPSWLASMAGIQFKLKTDYGTEYVKDLYDNDNDGNATEDLVVTTDANGIATINQLDDGIYQIEEISEINGFEGLSELYEVEVMAGEITNIEVENKLKYVPLTIHKTFKDTNEILGKVTFEIKRTSADNVEFETQTVTTDVNGEAVAYVPYGEYTITETSGVFGWTADPVTGVIVNTDNKVVNIENEIAYGNIIINKTVQSKQIEGSTELTDTVEGLKFEVVADSPLTYTNTLGETVTFDVNKIIEVTEANDGIQVPGETIGNEVIASYTTQMSADKCSVTITIENVPLGLYNVTEVEIPQMQNGAGEDLERYEVATGVVNVSAKGQNAEVYLSNLWKMGRLAIVKTAVDKVFDENLNKYVEVALEDVDYTQFAYRVEGTSYYGTPVDRTVYTNRSGRVAISLEIGEYTVTEIDNEKYKAYYSKDGETFAEAVEIENELVGPTYEVKSKELTTAYVKNELQYGYVEITKNLDDKATKIINETGTEEEVSAAYGITFYVQGEKPNGEMLTAEEGRIVIGKDGKGTSNKIPAGEYILVEDETTVPKYYVPAEQKEIKITKAHTEEEPLKITLQNKRGKGNLDVKTETYPEAGAAYPVVYKYIEIETDERGNIQKDAEGKYKTIATTEKTLEGDIQGEATAANIPAGLYKVWQESVPTGWEKDLPQIVEVPVQETGIAIFQITRTEEWQKNKLTITKEVYKEVQSTSGEPAEPEYTRAIAEDYAKLGLNPNESFEIKLTNTQTLEKYYVFVNDSGRSSITNLTPGTYEVEEKEKFKYELIGLYNTDQSITELTKDQNSGKYLIVIPDTEGATVSIIARNKINPDFGFGGSSQVDNYAKTTAAQLEEQVVTKSIIYVVDEQGEKLPGVKLQVIKVTNNAQTGEREETVVQLPGGEVEATTTSNRIVIKGLDEGDYIVRVTSVPTGYTIPSDTEFTVYKDASRVIRIEVQEKVDRGALTLRTYLTTESGNEINISSSKYKILNTETEEFLTFIKKPDGTYQKSNLPNATDTITVRQTPMQVSGIETGNYDIGLVGVSGDYGIVKDTVENVDLETNENKEVSVEVENKQIIDVAITQYYTFLLDSDGQLWKIYGRSAPVCMTTTAGQTYYGVKFAKIFTDNYNDSSISGIDTQGRVWYKGNCLGDEETEAMYGKNIVEMAINQNEALGKVAIDDNGNVYTWGAKYYIGIGETSSSEVVNSPICLTDKNTNPNNPLVLNKVKAVKCAITEYTTAIIDDEGRVWTWSNGSQNASGYTYEENVDEYWYPKCLSLIPQHPLAEAYNNGRTIVDIKGIRNGTFTAIDSIGKVWTWGYGTYGELGNGQTNNSQLPICASEHLSNNSYGVNSVELVSLVGGKESAGAIDNQGRLWTWGRNLNGKLGSMSGYDGVLPIIMCVSDDTSEGLYGTKIKKVEISDRIAVALDEENNVWTWGNADYVAGATTHNYTTYQVGPSIAIKPSKAELYITYNKNFDYNLEIISADSTGDDEWSAKVMVDKNGKVWAMGGNLGNFAGLGTTQSVKYDKPILIDISENTTFVQVANTQRNTILLDSEGKVWTTGNAGDGVIGIGSTTSVNYTSYLCISDMPSNPLYGTTIEKIYADHGKNAVLAIDSDGKVWTWGKNRNNTLRPTCESDSNANLQALYESGVKIVSGDILNGCIILLDDQGRIYVTGNVYFANMGEFSCVSTANFGPYNKLKEAYDSGIRVVEVGLIDNNNGGNACAVLLDSEGKLWYVGEANKSPTGEAVGGYFKCMSDVEGSKLKELADSGTKLVKMVTSGYTTYLVDSNGKLWVFGGNANAALGVIGSQITCASDYEALKLYGKKIKNVFAGNYSTVYVVDENGDLYLCQDNLFSAVKNDLYKVKVTKLDGQYVIDENNNKWTLGSKAAIVGTYEETVIETTKEQLEARVNANITYFSDFSSNNLLNARYSIGLDENGKVWFSGYIAGVEAYTGTEASETINQFTALNLGENIKIEKIVNNYESIVLLDDNGNIYTLIRSGGVYSFNFESGTTFTDVSYIENTWLFKDTNNNIYAMSDYYNSYGQLGIGTTGSQRTPAKVQFSESVDINLDDIIIDTAHQHIYYIDTTKHLWITGRNDYYQCGDGTTINRTTPYKVVTSTGNEIKVEQVVDNQLSTYILDENGYIYTSGGDPTATQSSYRYYDRCQIDRYNRSKFERVLDANPLEGYTFYDYTTPGTYKEIMLANDYVIGIETNNNIVEFGNSYKLSGDTQVNNPFYSGSATHLGNYGHLIKVIENPTYKYLDSRVLQTADGKIYNIYSATNIETTDKEIEETYGSYNNVLIKYTDGTVECYMYQMTNVYNTLVEKNPEILQKSLNEIYDLLNKGYYLNNNGKLYIWKYEFEGEYYSGTDEIICVNEKEDSILYGKTIIDATYYNGFRIIDSNNKLYATGRDSNIGLSIMNRNNENGNYYNNYYPTEITAIDNLQDPKLSHGWYIVQKKMGM